MQDNAEMEASPNDIGDAVKMYGPGLLKAGLNYANNVGDEALSRIVATDLHSYNGQWN